MGRHAAYRGRGAGRRGPYLLLAFVGLGMTTTGAITLGESLAAQGRIHPNQTADPSLTPTDTASSPAATSTAPVTSAPPTVETTAAPVAAAQPVRLLIPTIHVDAPVAPIGLTSAGQLASPTSMTGVGWYSGSSAPGTAGPAVFAGHRDSATSAAVFIDLDQLKAGDVVSVMLSDGSKIDYQVTATASFPGTRFPTSGVYGPLPDSELRLITCSGPLVDGRYLDNLIVDAQRKA